METEKHLCFVLEYVKGGELFEFVQHMHDALYREGCQSDIDEILIKKLVREMIEAVSWLHDHNIVHRDIKLESNIFLFVFFYTHTMYRCFGVC